MNVEKHLKKQIFIFSAMTTSDRLVSWLCYEDSNPQHEWYRFWFYTGRTQLPVACTVCQEKTGSS